MEIFDIVFNELQPYARIVQLVLIILITFIVFNIILQIIKGRLLNKIKNKKQRSNVAVFLDMLKYFYAFILLVIIAIYYSGNLGDLGFFAGLLTVAVGWALQKPISGVVAWVILVTRRPFHIGDRVIITGIIGDVSNITLTHIFLDEVGGTIDGEESSGRTIMIPTSIIFEQNVINYSERDDYILDEILVSITYESNLELAEKLITAAFKKSMKPFWEKYSRRISKDSHIRLKFQASGIDVVIRYYTLATKRNLISTTIRREIWKQINTTTEVSFAYPHTQIIIDKNVHDQIKK
jgi:small-conductance mechanosensitive channel